MQTQLVNPVIPPKVDASAVASWGSSMFESAQSTLAKLQSEERDILDKLAAARANGEAHLVGFYENQLTAEPSSSNAIPLRMRIAQMKADMAEWVASPMGRAYVKRNSR